MTDSTIDRAIERALGRDDHPLIGAWFVASTYDRDGGLRPIWCGRVVGPIAVSYLLIEIDDWPQRGDEPPVRRVIAMNELRLFDFYEREEVSRQAFAKAMRDYRDRTATATAPKPGVP